jgi:hypothetical protein
MPQQQLLLFLRVSQLVVLAIQEWLRHLLFGGECRTAMENERPFSAGNPYA